MNSKLTPLLVRLLRLPPEPPAPYGEEKSLRVFRASPQFLKYQMIMWGLSQAVLAAMFLFVFCVPLIAVLRRGNGTAVAVTLLIGCAGGVLFMAQALLSRFLVRLDYEMRWYKVTDRSLRIREGAWNVREMTMTFANIQNMEITQGPIQRWLGIADLKVQTAGGGGPSAASGRGGQAHSMFNMHVGYFRGVDNAEEILRMMEERLRRLRSAGLGDHDDPEEMAEEKERDGSASGTAERTAPDGLAAAPGRSPLLQAARALRDEARALKVTVQAHRQPPTAI